MTDAIVARPQLGFIGLGNMGVRVARRLCDAGYPLGVYSRTAEKARPLVDRGAQFYSSATELAHHSDVVLTMLPDDTTVQEVLIGEGGVLGTIRPGGTIVDLSSVHPSTSRNIAAAALRAGVSVLDAPVSGSTPQAEAGALILFVGGDRDVYEGCRPILEVIGSASFLMGPNGAGSTMKLVVNDLLGLEMQALAEAQTLGERAGLEKDLPRALEAAVLVVSATASRVPIVEVEAVRRSAATSRGLTPEQAAAVEALTTGIVNKLLHGPMVALRDAAGSPGGLRRSQSRILNVLRSDRARTA